jgi:two-component system, chemotaxis family, protein-glutamate methylesterase/glutaminase
MTARPPITRVLVCEDSRTYATSLASFLRYEGDLEVVGICSSAEEALEALPRLQPDLVTMDTELPGINGIEATQRIMRSHPTPIVVLSAYTPRSSERAATALAAGALEVLSKMDLPLDDPAGPRAIALRRRLARVARAYVRQRRPGGSRKRGAHHRRRGASAIGICASTGGPQALETVLTGLPADFPLPVLVVQHMGTGFMEGLVRWMDQRLSLPARVARGGDTAGPGIWFAPDDAHLLLEANLSFALDRETVSGSHRPSGDVLLKSIAAAVGPAGVAVVLTGMGRDGAEGVGAIRAAGGHTIAQDEATSAVFGMPKAAADNGAEVVLPLSEIATELRHLPVAEAAR